MKSVLNKTGQVVAVIILLFGLNVIPLFSQMARAATTVSINTAQQLQTVNGLGVNANAHNWTDTDVAEFKQAMDDTADLGQITWRVITDKTDWEATNDNADPFGYNWDYYNNIYSTGAIAAFWNTIEYLETNHPEQQITLNFMGDGPDWMGPNGGKSLATDKEDEWAEMIASLVYYGRTTRGLHFKLVSPTNEQEFTGGVEGIHIPADQYVRIMHKLSDRLDSLGLTDVRFIGPDNATTMHDYYNAMRTDPVVMNRTDHIAMHAYTASLNGVPDLLKNDTVYPGKDMWVTEFSAPCSGCDQGAPNPNNWANATGSLMQLFADLDQGAAGAQIYDAWDGYYRHHASMGYWGLIAYSGTPTTPGDYSKRKSYYVMRQAMKYVPRTAKMVSTTQGGVNLHAFTDTATGRLTLVGYNSGAAQTVNGSINASAGFAGVPLEYTRTNSTVNMGEENLPPVVIAANNAFTFDVPANTVFTLTGTTTPDTTPPPAPTNVAATIQSATRVNVAWQSGGGDTASYTLTRSDLTTPLASGLVSANYSDTTVQPNTTYQYTVTARDGAGNVSGPARSAFVTTPVASPVAVNAQSVTKQSSATASISTNITTTQPNTLLVAFITSDGPTAAQSFSAVTTPGLTWTLRQRANTQVGTAEIWTAPAQNTLTNATVSAQRARTSYRGALMVTAFSGVNNTAVGAGAAASAASGASNVTLTPTQANSVVWGVGYSKASATARTVGPNQTLIDQYLAGSTGTSWFQRLTEPVLSPGTPVTLNNPSPTTQRWNMAAIEILPLVSDTQAPTVPANLRAANVAATTVELAWDTATDNVAVTGYQVFRDGSEIAKTPNPQFTDTGRSPSTTYTYEVKAYDAAGNYSAASSPLVVTTPAPDTEAPSAPTGLSATQNGQTRVDLTWAASSDNVGVTGYTVLRDGAPLATLTGTTYADTTAVAGATYTYRVTARDAGGNVSPESAAATITISDVSAPTVNVTSPANNAVVRGTVTLAADASDNLGVAGVQFKVGSTNLGAEDTTSPYQATWATTAVADGTYTITAVARDAAGNTQQTSITVTVQNIAPSGLVAAYNFNATTGGTLADITGNGHTGTIAGATWASGKNGGALSFNGTSDWVTVADANDLDFTTAFTIEAWVKPSTTSGDWRTLVMKEATGSMPYGLYAFDNSGRPPAVYGRVGAPGSEVRATGGSALPTTTWSHITGTYDGSQLKLFVNGVQVGSANLSGNLAASTGVLRIGGNGMWGEYFGGLMDDLRIYNRALSPAEIVQDMNAAL